MFTLSEEVTGIVSLQGPMLRVHIAPRRTRHRARNLYATEIAFLKAMIESDPCDVYSAQWLYEYAIAAIEARLPTAITIHDWPLQVLRYQRSPYRVARSLMALRTLVSHRGEFVAVSPYMARALKTWTGRTATVVPNGFEDSKVVKAQQHRNERHNRVISVVNGFGRRKNTAPLFEAFHILRTDLPDLRLAMVGTDFEEGGPAATWAGANGVTDGVDFMGPLPYPEAQRMIGGSAVLVHPSLEESFGRTLIEAMAAGTPVVAGESSGAVPWVLDQGRSGVLVDVRNPKSIVEATKTLLYDADMWTRYSNAGIESVRTRFTLSATATRYLDVLSRTMEAFS